MTLLSRRLTLVLSCLIAFSASAASYKRATLRRDASAPLYWDTTKFTYRIATRTFSDRSQIRAIEAGVAAWAEVASRCSDWTFERGPDITSNPTIGYRPGQANENVIVMRTTNCRDVVPPGDSCLTLPLEQQNVICANKYQCWFDEEDDENTLAVTLTTYDVVERKGLLYDADIEFNAAPLEKGAPHLFTTVDSPACQRDQQHTGCVANDLRAVFTHELGHALGFDHVADPNSTMAETAGIGELTKRRIDPGTEAGFCDTYGHGGAVSGLRENKSDTSPSLCSSASSGMGGFTALLLLMSGIACRRRRRGAPRSL